jgi:hypothetical protein
MEEKSETPSGGQTTTCDKCGEPRVVYPPTPEYSELLLQPCPQGDSILRPFQCQSCDEINKRHWDKKHPIVQSQKREREERFRPGGFADY